MTYVNRSSEGGSRRSTGGLEAFIEERVREDNIPGLSVAVSKGDRVVWERGFGYADLTTSLPATASTIYLWFSVTKIVTATAIMCLADSGDLELDTPVDEYVPGFKIVSQPVPVTIRHLLSHSAGLANPVPIRWVRSAEELAPDPKAFVHRLLRRHRKLKFTPGRHASYSNLGYLVLGEVISEVSGLRYEEYIRNEILSPLRMNRTGFTYPAPREPHERATPYHPLPKPLTPLFKVAMPRGIVGSRFGRYVVFNPFYVQGPAYGGLVGSVHEATRFAGLHLNDGRVDDTRVLSAGSVEAMQSVTSRGGKRDFGLGWFRSSEASRQGTTFVEHLGGGAGFWNVMRLYPEQSLGVVMMGNTTRYDHEAILDAISHLDWSESTPADKGT